MSPGARLVVLLSEEIHRDGIERLRKRADVRIASSPDPSVLAREVAAADALIVRSTPLPRSIIGAGPRLRVIGRHGAGVDNIDVEAASEAGIVVVNTPTSNVESVAEFTIAVLLTLTRRIVEGSMALKRADLWHAEESLPGQVVRLGLTGSELASQTLGVVGFGAIGSAVARRAKALGMEVAGYDPWVSKESMRALGVKPVPNLKSLLPEVDCLTVHVPSTRDTVGMIGAGELMLMRSGAYLINTSRGDVVDEAALVSAVESRALAGAAVDVFTREPPAAGDPLLTCDRILATPHMAAMTGESLRRMSLEVVGGVLAALDGDIPRNAVNGEQASGFGQKG